VRLNLGQQKAAQMEIAARAVVLVATIIIVYLFFQ